MTDNFHDPYGRQSSGMSEKEDQQSTLMDGTQKHSPQAQLSFDNGKLIKRKPIDYNEEAEYDSCREWLRLITALVSIIIAIIAVYPIHLGVDCYLDSTTDGELDLTQCTNIFNLEYSLSILVGAVVTEAVTLFLFIYSCRHEFCGIKRRYTTGLVCCRADRAHSPVVYPLSQSGNV